MEKLIHINGVSINVKWINWNAGSRTVLVFLHEALGSVIQWKSFPEKLCDALGLTGLIIERCGHGSSSPLPDSPRDANYLHESTKETKAVLDAVLTVDSQIIVMGHSDGGTIALLLAKYFPGNISGIVTMAAHTFVEPETLAGIGPAVEAYEAGKLDGLKRIHGEKTDRLFYAWADTWRADIFRSWDIREEIIGISCPVLAMQGTKDQYGTKAQVDSIAEAAVNCETYMIPDCGHHPHIEKPEEVISTISNWHSSF